ncbi:MAG: ABC transporter permease [Oscillospiraceae bacterium]|nr:ABC transporter permease [Oscillospiraceae bacterium]
MRYSIKKIGTMLLTMVIVSFLTFVAFSLLAGDAAEIILGTEATPERLAALRESLGLNKPLLVRYGHWVLDFVAGDMGTSYQYNLPVSQLVGERLGPTLTLTAIAFVIIVAVSVPLGVATAKHAGGRLDRVITVVNQVVMSVPPFFTGILFTYIFGLVLQFFIAGTFPIGGSAWDYISYLFFPALAVALPRIAMTVRLLRGCILQEAKKDYVRTSMSRGRSRGDILYRHVLKNTLVPLITYLAMTVADLFAGSVIIEQVFSVPGIGRLLLTSIFNRDYPVAEAIVVILAFWVVLCNLLGDLLSRRIDPRLESGEGGGV